MQNVIIFGASGHGSVVLDCVVQEGKYKVAGYIDSFRKKGNSHNGYPILGSELDIPYIVDKYAIQGGVVAIGDNWTRRLVVDKILKICPNFNFITVVHPNATIGMNVHIGKGTVIMPGVVVNANSEIGNYCILNTNSSLGHDSYMSNYSSLAPRSCSGGNLFLGKYSAIGLGTNIIENISIAEHTIIGAGSLVVEDIKCFVLAYGLPAKFVRNRKIGEKYLSGSKFPKLTQLLVSNS